MTFQSPPLFYLAVGFDPFLEVLDGVLTFPLIVISCGVLPISRPRLYRLHMRAARLNEFTHDMANGLSIEDVSRPAASASDDVVIEIDGRAVITP